MSETAPALMAADHLILAERQLDAANAAIERLLNPLRNEHGEIINPPSPADGTAALLALSAAQTHTSIANAQFMHDLTMAVMRVASRGSPALGIVRG